MRGEHGECGIVRFFAGVPEGNLEILRAVHNCMHIMYNLVLVYVYTSPTCVSSVLRRDEDPCSGVGFPNPAKNGPVPGFQRTGTSRHLRQRCWKPGWLVKILTRTRRQLRIPVTGRLDYSVTSLVIRHSGFAPLSDYQTGYWRYPRLPGGYLT
jgi:hypothetical protein